MQSPLERSDGTKSPTSQIYVLYKSTGRNVRIFIQRDANVSPFKTLNTVSRWNGVKGQENDKRLHTTPEIGNIRALNGCAGRLFGAATLHNHKNSANKSNRNAMNRN